MEVVHKHGKLPVLMEIRISEFWLEQYKGYNGDKSCIRNKGEQLN
jgi:hypothetical protein